MRPGHKGSHQDKGVAGRQRIGHEDAGGSQQNVSGRVRIPELVAWWGKEKREKRVKEAEGGSR
ncbi:hypothetical protein E2C01_083783 [Portunus trituberculatus]|uniref:Uncharacterized protein n=1 Tax=Portunus trituberculatus TaxID=210409 RepID=A0A5B7ITC6_PORTR|nr:hypothetical protein [Portunus trituberculatus]